MNLSENAGNYLTELDSTACIVTGAYEGIWKGVKTWELIFMEMMYRRL